ncbi:C-5 cytosine-specific DNA methyltransferase [Metamycoplasma auris 15026]|uniref:C-5 cytosine-specific DNA methyltransferase n=1 Tax=Metamycoplasma auris 15026 TaxID=1188233 RepID=N9VCK1_9BACT|nr:hypothetical protein [Metamycoplasma auris]ENY69126.1 C-5 cytosine-specific DNA methyltransferase [Metamycoplasma auris 15026]
MKKLVLWLLFDDNHCSFANAILEHPEVFSRYDAVYAYGFGKNKILETTKKLQNISWTYTQFDLALTNEKLIKELKTYPKPDIVLASPPCESFSMADCSCRMSQTYDNDKWIVRSREWYRNRALTVNVPNKTRDFIKKERNRLNGEGCASGLVHIIETFKPKAYVIENPENSKIWQFFANHWNFKGFRNITYYYNYNLNFSKKPTCFLSNIQLNLKKQTLKEGYNKTHFLNGNYKQRSSIPSALILDILNQIILKGEIKNEEVI